MRKKTLNLRYCCRLFVTRVQSNKRNEIESLLNVIIQSRNRNNNESCVIEFVHLIQAKPIKFHQLV